MTTTSTRFEVATDEAGLRLDQVIPRHVPGLSRRKARAVIDLGGVFVDRARTKVASRQMRAGQMVEVNVGGALEHAKDEVPALETPETPAPAPAPSASASVPAPVAARVVHVDPHVIVVDKPAGLVTAPTPESDRGDLFDQLRRAYGEVYLVHRLDLPTSGLLVFARTRAANKLLGDAFVRHDIDREYRAVVLGAVAAQTIDRPVGGKRAVTHVTPVEALGGEARELAGTTLLSVRLETGRSHQIRLHLSGLGHPVAGDHQHGGTLERTFSPKAPRLALHAAVLGFTHPATGVRVRFEAPLPPDLASWVERLRALRG